MNPFNYAFFQHYFHTEPYYKEYKCFPFGERSHGYIGVLEFYKENFNIQDNKSVIKLLEATLYIIGKNAKCPCGSGLKFKNCHQDKVEYLRRNVGHEKIKKSYKGVKRIV